MIIFLVETFFPSMQAELLRFDKSKTLVFIDFETFNLALTFVQNRPWECGMIRVKGDQIIDQKEYLIKWDTDLKIGAQAALITRYDPIRMKREGIPPEYAFPTIYDWLFKADYIVGHNIFGFDMYLWLEWCKLNKKSWDWVLPKIIDTNIIAKGIKMNQPYKSGQSLIEYNFKMAEIRNLRGVKTNLTAMGKELEIQHDYEFGTHNALQDLILNVAVWQKLKWQFEL